MTSFDKVDSRLSFGHVASPGTYATTVTRPDLFRNYLIQQIASDPAIDVRYLWLMVDREDATPENVMRAATRSVEATR